MTRPISHNQVSNYMRCPFAYKLRYIDHLETPKTSINRLWGRGWHRGIESWHYAERDGHLLDHVNRETADALKPYDLDGHFNTMLSLVDEHAAIIAASPSTNPTATKAYKDWAASVKLPDLRQRTADHANAQDGLQKYPSTADLWSRVIRHSLMAQHYLAFDEAHPLLTLPTGGLAIELDISVTTPQGEMRAIIDQLRQFPSGPLVTDLKSNKDDPTPEDVEANYQFTHYQMVANLHDLLPKVAGAAWYSLRTGKVFLQSPISHASLGEWLEVIADMQDGHERNRFPHRRGDWCRTCDWYDEHCKPTLPEGDPA